jgi:hypothetical protein
MHGWEGGGAVTLAVPALVLNPTLYIAFLKWNRKISIFSLSYLKMSGVLGVVNLFMVF